ncbi:MAG TPA: glycosyltransferase [Anaerolineae bacterium]|nr:glycosyltransferase [Anaerolineae bacterium]
MRLIYIIGRYPELTTTFIEREISILRRLGGIEVQPLSIRYPLTPSDISPEHEKIRAETLYLVPQHWRHFNFLRCLAANLYFLFLRPLHYFGTLIYLLSGAHPNLRTRFTTVLHFWQGVYAAYLLRRSDFAHLHAHFIDRAVVVALVVSRLLDKSYSLTAHANDIYTKRILIREKILNAKFVVTVSQHNQAYLLKTTPGLAADKVQVLHPWVDPSRFSRSSPQPDRSCLRILSVGRLVEKKGHRDLIEACHLLRERGVAFECCIVGSGPLRRELEQDIARYKLQHQVRLLGGQPEREVFRLLEAWANVFVLPCVVAPDGDRDGIPVSLAEAMALELPVVSTDIVGIRELVRPGTGILAPPHDPPALAQALQDIHAAGAAARAEMGCKGRAVVEAEFNLLKGTAHLAGLFREAVAERAAELA